MAVLAGEVCTSLGIRGNPLIIPKPCRDCFDILACAGAEDCQDSDALSHTTDTHGEHRILRLMAQGILPPIDDAAIEKAKSYADTAKKNSSSALR